VTRSAISACSLSLASSCASSTAIDLPLALSLALPLLSLALAESLVTSRVAIVGSNLLVTRPVTSARCFSLISSSNVAFSFACYFSSAYSSSSWPFQRLSRKVVTWRLAIRSNCSSDSPCDFRLLSLFLFHVRYHSFIFRLCSLLSS
jgi:hypothetical protein